MLTNNQLAGSTAFRLCLQTVCLPDTLANVCGEADHFTAIVLPAQIKEKLATKDHLWKSQQNLSLKLLGDLLEGDAGIFDREHRKKAVLRGRLLKLKNSSHRFEPPCMQRYSKAY